MDRSGLDPAHCDACCASHCAQLRNSLFILFFNSNMEEVIRVCCNSIVMFLGDDSILNLCITSKAIFSPVHESINKNLIFRYAGTNNTFKYYQPQQLSVRGFFGLHKPTLHSSFSFTFNTLPSSLTHLSFGNNFDMPVDNLLPPSLTNLAFGNSFDQPVDALPPKLTHLFFGKNFNQPIQHLPSALTHLTLGSEFRQDFNSLPPSLLVLRFHDGFCAMYDYNIETLPPKLHTLRLIHNFRSMVLPDSLTSLSMAFGYDFTFPPHLKTLKFNDIDDQLESLPTSLQTLSVADNRREDDVELRIPILPPKLAKLSVAGYYKLALPLPATITSLDIPYSGQIAKMKLSGFDSLVHLSLYSVSSSAVVNNSILPRNLKHLDIYASVYMEDISRAVSINFSALPLEHLCISGKYFKLGQLPTTLKVLKVETADHVELPPKLEELHINDGSFDSLPPTMHKLVLKHLFKAFLPPLPSNLEELNIGAAYNHPIPALPSKLRKLVLDNAFNLALPPLPSALKELTIGRRIQLKSGGSQVASASAICSTPLAFPSSLTKLVLIFQLEEPLSYLPPGLKELEVYSKFPLPPLPLTLETFKLNRQIFFPDTSFLVQ